MISNIRVELKTRASTIQKRETKEHKTLVQSSENIIHQIGTIEMNHVLIIKEERKYNEKIEK